MWSICNSIWISMEFVNFLTKSYILYQWQYTHNLLTIIFRYFLVILGRFSLILILGHSHHLAISHVPFISFAWLFQFVTLLSMRNYFCFVWGSMARPYSKTHIPYTECMHIWKSLYVIGGERRTKSCITCWLQRKSIANKTLIYSYS